MSGDASLGEQIFWATRLLADVTAQTTSLLDTIQDRFESLAGRLDAQHLQFIEDDVHTDPGNWIPFGWVSNFELLRERQSPREFLAVQVDFGSEEDLHPAGPQTLLSVLYASDGPWSYREPEARFELRDSLELWEGYHFRLLASRLFAWQDQSDTYWAYVLPLTSLNSLADVDRQIIAPLGVLLGVRPGEALAPETAARAFRDADKVLAFRARDGALRLTDPRA